MYNMPEFLNPSILDYVDKWMNCEDLAMCLMVADFLAKVTYPQVSCVGLKAKHYPYNLEAQNSEFKIKKNQLYTHKKILGYAKSHCSFNNITVKTSCRSEFSYYLIDCLHSVINFNCMIGKHAGSACISFLIILMLS